MGPRLLVAAACLVNLLTGACLGVAIDRTWLVEKPRHHRRGGPKMMVAEIGDALKLDAAQREKVTAICEARKPEFDDIFKEIGPKMEAVRRALENDVRAILTPEQLPRFEDYLKEKQRKEKEMRERWEHGDRADRDRGPDRGGPDRSK
ncbi:hypothetical protein HY251_08990 [bacterium]|nr:hypothetical protein [bacterium]